MAALAHGELVKFKFKAVLVALVDNVSQEVDDAALVIRIELLDSKAELVLLLVVHRPLAYLLFEGLLHEAVDLILYSLAL